MGMAVWSACCKSCGYVLQMLCSCDMHHATGMLQGPCSVLFMSHGQTMGHHVAFWPILLKLCMSGV